MASENTAVETMCFFDAPQWSWKKTVNGFHLNELTNRVEVKLEHARGYDSRKSLVEIPSDFIRFYGETLKGFPTQQEESPPVKWKDAHFRVLEEAKRYYFYLAYKAEDKTVIAVPLWYWVPSNMPKWIKQGTKVRYGYDW